MSLLLDQQARRKARSLSAVRSRIMASIRGTNTRPELAVRSLVHRLGYRFRLHASELPGTPDVVFRVRKKVIFVHGCFWHRHTCRDGKKVPSKNKRYWLPKFARNRARDVTARRSLRRDGWSSLVVWECEVRAPERLTRKLVGFLGEA